MSTPTDVQVERVYLIVLDQLLQLPLKPRDAVVVGDVDHAGAGQRLVRRQGWNTTGSIYPSLRRLMKEKPKVGVSCIIVYEGV